MKIIIIVFFIRIFSEIILILAKLYRRYEERKLKEVLEELEDDH